MKKFGFLMLAIVIAMSMVGCQARSIGIIGGQGRYNKQYKSEREPVKAVMLDGSIYFETGEDNDMQGRCGTLDGNFTKTVDKWELPKRDNEANFELRNKNYCGYQMGIIEGTIEVPIGDDWEIFKKINEPEKDLTQYKYIFKVEGPTQYQHGDSEYVILANDLNISANDVAKSMFSSSSDDYIDIYILARD